MCSMPLSIICMRTMHRQVVTICVCVCVCVCVWLRSWYIQCTAYSVHNVMLDLVLLHTRIILVCMCLVGHYRSPYQGGQVFGAPQPGAMYPGPGGAPGGAPWAGQYPYQQAAAAAATAQGQPQADPNHQAAWAAYYQQLYAQAQAQAQQGAQR